MPDATLTRCDFESSDLLVKLDMTLPGDVNANRISVMSDAKGWELR